MRDNQGRRVHLIRDAERNLRRLVSPSARTISLEYDNAGRVNRAQDDDGHTIDYSYDSAGRLVVVSMNRQVIFRYLYDSLRVDHMLAIEDGSGNVLLTNRYGEDGRVSGQISADRSEYSYRYIVDRGG